MVKENKTNAMRALDAKKIPYQVHFYECDEFMDGIQVARACGMDENKVFKTIVTISAKKIIHVFVLPVGREIDLKAAARCVHEKSVEMLPLKDLQSTTGYIRGGCSPIGMKKSYDVILEKSALNYETIIFSAGRLGAQIEMDPKLLNQVCKCTYAEFTID